MEKEKFEHLKSVVTELKLLLNGQIINNSIIVDVFLTPNNWETAHIVYDFRKNYKDFPFNYDNKFGLVIVTDKEELIDSQMIQFDLSIINENIQLFSKME